jgi:hypothetical protein
VPKALPKLLSLMRKDCCRTLAPKNPRSRPYRRPKRPRWRVFRPECASGESPTEKALKRRGICDRKRTHERKNARETLRPHAQSRRGPFLRPLRGRVPRGRRSLGRPVGPAGPRRGWGGVHHRLYAQLVVMRMSALTPVRTGGGDVAGKVYPPCRRRLPGEPTTSEIAADRGGGGAFGRGGGPARSTNLDARFSAMRMVSLSPVRTGGGGVRGKVYPACRPPSSRGGQTHPK